MGYTYKNTAPTATTVVLVSENKSSASHIHLAAGSQVELDYPGLDGYVPHTLRRLDHTGVDISQDVVRAIEVARTVAKFEKVGKPLESVAIPAESEPVKEAVVVVPDEQPVAGEAGEIVLDASQESKEVAVVVPDEPPVAGKAKKNFFNKKRS